ncbi:MAG: YCF48-related protein [Deltaproteobacteria bacterium]
MRRQGRSQSGPAGSPMLALLWFLLPVMLSYGAAAAADSRKSSDRNAPEVREPSPIEDDANLHDVQFVGSRSGWAVGDRGVIWHSEDGGESWLLQSSGVNCPLRSVCFLSDRVGWVAGGGTAPYTRHPYGVVLTTTDGGRTWKPLVAPPASAAPADARLRNAAAAPANKTDRPEPTLPRLRKIRFFSREEGIAVGEGTGSDPSGVFSTEDGGQSWRALPGKASPGWLSAAFLGPDAGILVGANGSRALVMEDKVVVPQRFERLGVRGLHDVALGGENSGWLVGDGGLVLRTENAGLVWQPPPVPLADGIRDAFDFRTVCCRGNKIWVAGQPGSAVWHSPDGGQAWEKRPTGQAQPLARLHFSTDQRGWAVGALGTILRTDDGGQTWRAVRGAGRRVALMALFGSTPQVGLGLIAEQSGDAGYRSLVAVVAHEEGASRDATVVESIARLEDAVTTAGGSASQIGWQLPLVIPGLERDFDRLVADWNRRTENRLEEILIGGLVRQIRTWRPSVLIIQQPETGDALMRLIGQAALKAVDQAADSTRFLEQQELAGLEPWQVQKVFALLPPGSSGHVNVDPFRYLPQLGETTNLIAATAEGLFREQSEFKPPREAYRLIRSQWADGQGATIAGGFFAGISLPPGSAARRALRVFDDGDLETRLKIARKQRNFAAITEQTLDDTRRAGQLIAQLPEMVQGMSDSQAAWQMTHLAERYRAIGQWELGELTLIELVEKYPDQPAAMRAMQQLIQMWGSGEVTWRRLRRSGSGQERDTHHVAARMQAIIQQVEARLQKQREGARQSIFDSDDVAADAPPADAAPPPLTRESRTFRRDLDQKIRFWQTRALKLAQSLERRDRALAAEPAVQFPLAAIYRKRTLALKSDEIYRRYVVHETGTPWAQAAEGEIWLSNPFRPATGPTAACGFTSKRPVLDGVLSDPCWRDAAELPLVASARDGKDDSRRALTMLCYDSEYLYFAANLPRAEGMPADGSAGRERRHDEDLADFDRVLLSLDVDRDYVTSFDFAVDQRGCTAESCWNDASWDPRWFVAVAGDETHWRVEAAIPLEELTPLTPQRGAGWALGITRIIPAIGVESWTLPAAATPRPENFGLLRFDGPGDPR